MRRNDDVHDCNRLCSFAWLLGKIREREGRMGLANFSGESKLKATSPSQYITDIQIITSD